jgi:hypothetical protein
MFSKQESARLQQQFWERFGKYMAPVPSVREAPVNWINYRTGIKDVYFRTQANRSGASIAIVIAHSDPDRRLAFFKRFEALKNLLESELEESWQWREAFTDEEGKTSSRIYTTLGGVNVLLEKDWPAIISFFKPRLLALDRFWDQSRDIFETVIE